MKALTLWQPWATLIALGEKQYETRDWPTSYRGPLAIHAAKKWNADIRAAAEDDDIAEALAAHGLLRGCELPLGAIVATCRLVECHRMDWSLIDSISDKEEAFGDWDPGRYAWELADVVALPQPIPAKGAQGLWEWQEPK